MGSFKLGFIGLIFLLIFVKFTVGLKCYVCNSDHNPKCADPFNNSTFEITDCSKMYKSENGKVTVCSRIIQKKSGKTTTIRTCTQLPEARETGNGFEMRCDRQASSTNVDSVNNCWCKGLDGCNSFYKALPPGAGGYGNEKGHSDLLLPMTSIILGLVLSAAFL